MFYSGALPRLQLRSPIAIQWQVGSRRSILPRCPIPGRSYTTAPSSNNSTDKDSSSSDPAVLTPESNKEQDQRQRHRSPWRRRIIYATIFGGLGYTIGKILDNKFLGGPPIPGTEEDKREIEQIHRFYSIAVPIVRELKHDPDYVESDVYENFSEEKKMHMLVAGPLRGSGGVPLQVCSFFCILFTQPAV